MAARTFWVKANLNHLNELASSLWLDSDRAAAFQGLCCGCTGVECPAGVPAPFLRAWKIGAEWRSEAEVFRASRKQGGEASAKARKDKFGTSQPPRASAEHMFEPGASPEHMFDGCAPSPEHPFLVSDELMPGPGDGRNEGTRTPTPADTDHADTELDGWDADAEPTAAQEISGWPR
jgi:hypothetical protein